MKNADKKSLTIFKMGTKIRNAYVAGKFYPSTSSGIKDLFDQLKSPTETADFDDLLDKNIIGAILPHAGYIYSGAHVIPFFDILNKGKQSFESIIILHPIHRGGRIDCASDNSNFWSSPLGKTELDHAFIHSMGIELSDDLLKWEHSAEVFLPFIQNYLPKNTKIIPIGMTMQKPEVARDISGMISKAQKETGRKTGMIASSDFSHFVAPGVGRMMDQKVIDRILAFDPEGVYNVIREENISVCGFGPIMALLFYANSLEKPVKARILSRGHSGEVNPASPDSVVDYVSILMYQD